MDLNKDEMARIMPECEITKKVGIFGAKPVQVRVTTDKGGYVPGERMAINISVDNHSDKKIEKYKAFISQKVKYEGKAWCTWHNKRTHKVAKIKEKIMSPEVKQQKFTTSLIVPSVPPSDLPNCSIIVIEYKVKVHVICGDKICVKFPIRIGTIPLQTTQYGMGEANISYPPPTYVESMFGPVEIDEKDDDKGSLLGSNKYTPLYPYLHFE